MLLRETDFLTKEGGAPLFMQNHQYLHNQSNQKIAWNKTRIWAELLLNKKSPSTLDDEKKSYSMNALNDTMEKININNNGNKNSKKSLNYGLKIFDQPDRIIRKDADRTFSTEPKRQLLITLLTAQKTLFNDYQQTQSYVSGILLLFYDVDTVFDMMFTLGRHPKYNMSGYWRAEAVTQGIDAWVLFDHLSTINQPLYNHLLSRNIFPDTFIQKWFGGLAVQVMPIEHLIEFWTQFFKHGFRYLFKFVLSLLQTLSPLLLNKNFAAHQLYEVLRVDRKSQFWRVIDTKSMSPNAPNMNSLSEYDQIGLFFTKILSDANSVGDNHYINSIDKIDFQTAREISFQKHLLVRFRDAAVKVTYKGFQVDSDNENESDEFPECPICQEYADIYCNDCKLNLCNDCHEKEPEDHKKNHNIKVLDSDEE